MEKPTHSMLAQLNAHRKRSRHQFEITAQKNHDRHIECDLFCHQVSEITAKRFAFKYKNPQLPLRIVHFGARGILDQGKKL